MLAPLLLAAAALADPPLSAGYRLVDAGHDLDAPVALVVLTPGVAEAAFQPLVTALEDAGLDAWTVAVTAVAPLPEEGADRWIAEFLLPAAVAALRAREPRAAALALVGHGPGGTLALMTAPRVAPRAVAVLGAPLGPIPSLALEELAARPLSAVGSVDLAQPHDWRGHDLATLLLGDPPLPLAPLPVPLARAWLRWAAEGPPLDPATLFFPVFVGAAALDHLVPVETVHAPAERMPDATFVRFGLLRLDLIDPEHSDLLRERRFLDEVAGWVKGQL
ncbi:MAG: hypothetical protein ABIO70_14330 [Pseudomonadota bacterium]